MKAAVLEDHGEQEKGSVLDIDNWEKEWICTSGMNVVTPEWDPNDKSNEAKLTIVQEACLEDHPTLRVHSMLLGFFDDDGNF